MTQNPLDGRKDLARRDRVREIDQPALSVLGADLLARAIFSIVVAQYAAREVDDVANILGHISALQNGAQQGRGETVAPSLGDDDLQSGAAVRVLCRDEASRVPTASGQAPTIVRER